MTTADVVRTEDHGISPYLVRAADQKHVTITLLGLLLGHYGSRQESMYVLEIFKNLFARLLNLLIATERTLRSTQRLTQTSTPKLR